jgi:hypothetical protein
MTVSKVMVTVKLDPQRASLADARELLGVDPDAFDQDFGVISVSPDEDLYAVLVEHDAVADMKPDERVSGPYSNPPIEPFGPPQ